MNLKTAEQKNMELDDGERSGWRENEDTGSQGERKEEIHFHLRKLKLSLEKCIDQLGWHKKRT